MLPSSNIRTNEHLCAPRPLFFKGNNDVLLITQGSKLCDFSSVTVLTDHTQHRSCLCFVFPHNLVSSLQLCWREPFVTLIHLTNITEAPQLCARHLLCVYYAPSTLLSTGHSVPSRSFLLLIPFRPFPGAVEDSADPRICRCSVSHQDILPNQRYNTNVRVKKKVKHFT